MGKIKNRALIVSKYGPGHDKYTVITLWSRFPVWQLIRVQNTFWRTKYMIYKLRIPVQMFLALAPPPRTPMANIYFPW